MQRTSRCKHDAAEHPSPPAPIPAELETRAALAAMLPCCNCCCCCCETVFWQPANSSRHLFISVRLHCSGSAWAHCVRFKASTPSAAAAVLPPTSAVEASSPVSEDALDADCASRRQAVKLPKHVTEHDSGVTAMQLPYLRTQHSAASISQTQRSGLPGWAAHEKPCSIVHEELHPSADRLFPSSHWTRTGTGRRGAKSMPTRGRKRGQQRIEDAKDSSAAEPDGVLNRIHGNLQTEKQRARGKPSQALHTHGLPSLQIR